jgi:hypothetical protein
LRKTLHVPPLHAPTESSSAREDGGPAFPQAREIGRMNFVGMSLRDQFAAHAPSEIPQWFSAAWAEHTPTPLPLSISSAIAQHERARKLSAMDEERLRSWLDDGSYDLDDPELAEIGEEVVNAINASRENSIAAGKEHELALYFSWRWYFADEMLKARQR